MKPPKGPGGSMS